MLQDNASPHTAHIETATMEQCGFELLTQAAYLPDLAPLLKEYFRGKHFGSDFEVKIAVEQWINKQERASSGLALDNWNLVGKNVLMCLETM